MENKRFFTSEEKEIALKRQEFMCGSCGEDLWRLPLGYGQGHHILPYSMGGETSIDNEVVLCPNCHVIHDNMAICGQLWGGYDIADMEDEQIRDMAKFEWAIEQSRINAQNPKIQKTIRRFKRKVGLA